MEDPSTSRGRGRGRPRGRAQGGGSLRGRGDGRARARGGGRARARGLNVSRALNFEISLPRQDSDVVDVTLAGPSQPTTSLAEDLKKIKKMRVQDKKNLARLSGEQRAQLKEMRDRKEVAQFLMPDAPSKKTRKVSPQRVPCPLLPGIPEVPPPRVPHSWELKKRESTPDASGPSRFLNPEEPPANTETPTQKENELVFTPSTLISTPVTIDRETVDMTSIIDADIQLIGFSPVPSTSTAPIPVPSPVPSSSSFTRLEPSIYEDDAERDILEWERSVGQNPGSDIDDDVVDELPADFGATGRRVAAEFPVNVEDELPGELIDALTHIDQRDDSALRELASQDMLVFDWSNDPNTFTGQREDFTGQADTVRISSAIPTLRHFLDLKGGRR